ncbi:hypothetical protein GGS26DRAFT_548534 [Hypomontagnella submonticulosa]|nr:hypothetical protein GGS26DRAFT_548534 [Hypomontagnella submonticulosa]
MCSEVLFTYRCGCTERTVFECPDSDPQPHSRRRRQCYGPADDSIIETMLDEDCHDCSQVQRHFMYDERTSPPSSSFPPCATSCPGILQERSLNLPSKRPPGWIAGPLVGEQMQRLSPLRNFWV